jgi:hypothetical protein
LTAAAPARGNRAWTVLRRALLLVATLALLSTLAWLLLPRGKSDAVVQDSSAHSVGTRVIAPAPARPARRSVRPATARASSGVTIAGIVVQSDGTPISSATVRAIALEGTDEFAVRRTAADGRFEMPSLPLQDYRLYAHTGRHLPAYWGPVEFTQSGERRQVLIRLQPGLTIEGRVLTSQGTPVAGAHVGSSDVGSGMVTTDSDGYFKLMGLRAGEVNVFAAAPGYASRHLSGLVAGSRDVVLTLEEPGSLSAPVHSARDFGRVLASLCQRRKEAGERLCVARRVYESAPTSILLERLASGDYELVIDADQSTRYRTPVTIRAGQQTTLAPIELR